MSGCAAGAALVGARQVRGLPSGHRAADLGFSAASVGVRTLLIEGAAELDVTERAVELDVIERAVAARPRA
jgi:hypothetical protein